MQSYASVSGMPGSRLTTGAARWARGVVVGLLTLLLGSGAHISAGGQAPPAGATLVLTLLVAGLAVAISGHRWTVSSLLGLFLLTQGGVHLLAMSATAMPHGAGLDPLMISTHAVAAIVLVLIVLHGERALVRLLSRLMPHAPRRHSVITSLTAGPFPFSDDVLARRWIPALQRGRAPPAIF